MAAPLSGWATLRDYAIVEFLANPPKSEGPISKTDDKLFNKLRASFKDVGLDESELPPYMNSLDSFHNCIDLFSNDKNGNLKSKVKTSYAAMESLIELCGFDPTTVDVFAAIGAIKRNFKGVPYVQPAATFPVRSTAMAPASTEIRPLFATLHHAPIELPEQVLAMIVLLLRDLTSAAADADARAAASSFVDFRRDSLHAGLMRGIGSVCRLWRRLAKGVRMGDELAWLRVQGAAEAADCLSSFPHAKSLRIVGDAAAGEIVSALGSGSVARLAITNNSALRGCDR
jgi:hypothetical protein